MLSLIHLAADYGAKPERFVKKPTFLICLQITLAARLFLARTSENHKFKRPACTFFQYISGRMKLLFRVLQNGSKLLQSELMLGWMNTTKTWARPCIEIPDNCLFPKRFHAG
jgi:hypothetical protein